jgi:hypothetical protein
MGRRKSVEIKDNACCYQIADANLSLVSFVEDWFLTGSFRHGYIACLGCWGSNSQESADNRRTLFWAVQKFSVLHQLLKIDHITITLIKILLKKIIKMQRAEPTNCEYEQWK